MPLAHHKSLAEGRPLIAAASAPFGLDFGMFRHLQGIIDLDSEVPHRAFQLLVPEKQLNGPEVLSAPVDQRCLCAAQGVSAVIFRIKANEGNPAIDDPGVLASGDVG